MEFTFSITQTVKDAWTLFKLHWKFFVGVTLVVFVLNLLGGEKIPGIIQFIAFIGSIVWSIVMMKISLFAADAHEQELSFSRIKSMLPHWKQVLGIIGVAILSLLIVLGGFVLLIVPGIYFAFRLSFSYLAFLDRHEGIKKSLRYSWDITKGSVIWTVILTSIVSGLLYLVGFILLGVGILVTYPIAMILMAKLYRTLSARNSGHMAVAPQPAEIPAHTEPTPEPHHESERPSQ